MKLDIDKIESIIREAASEIIMPRFCNLQDCDIETKADDQDFVTIADKEAEKFIAAELKKIYPQAMVIGEEGVFNNPEVINVLKEDGLSFVIDPVDGTSNFKNGKDDFGVMIGCAYKCEIIAGFIYLPVYDKMVIGEKNSGAYINGCPKKVTKKAVELKDMVGIVHPRASFYKDYVKTIYWKHCCASTYVDFVEDKIDFFSNIYRKMNQWDHMAGVLLSIESGGYVKDLAGENYDFTRNNQRLIVADSKNDYDKLSALANKFFQETT